ncbi:MAG: DNA (cytosine-5-)-methyltransferase [Candidatus Lokiarchaeota archaeon]|nr:DNA (cytosine-5-)-methyltransferase [Candidatus Lokiarchaeota archaeon]MBD3340813.1 DNA (cytosine-5-)-methyltransferase [Candidatus Lokiarchaeota archaeon]
MIIDLFSGAGGLSYGFERAGFKIGLAVEKEKSFSESFMYNHPNCLCLNEDITKLECEHVAKNYIKNKKIDGIIGGPPCQGFSTVGNRKIDDPRNTLIYFFMQWVDYFKPNFYLMENVSGILSMAGGKVKKKIQEIYNEMGYSCIIKKLNAANYGVPQLRQRVFFIGSRDDSIKTFKIPKTNRKDIAQRTLFERHDLPRYLTVRDAISDILEMPPFTQDFENDLAKDYSLEPKTKYQEKMRKNSKALYEHFAPDHSRLVIERISHIKQGENHSSLPKKYQLSSGYPNIYGRLHLDNPADTITGNCGCVSAPGRFIHPIQDRAISVREAARLQSFPDIYRFFGNLSERYKQVGNAVPPLLSFAIAKVLHSQYVVV